MFIANEEEQALQKLEDDVQDTQNLLRGNKREMDTLESDLGKLHRKILIENQTTQSIILDSIMNLEKRLLGQMNEEKQ